MDISKGFFISAATLFSSEEKRASPELLSEFILERESAHTPLCVFPASEHVSVFGGEEKYSLRGKSSLQLVLL